MSNKPSIEEQVAALTPEQKEKIPKIGKIAAIVQLVPMIPGGLFLLIGIFSMLSNPTAWNDTAFYGFLILIAILCAWAVGVLLFVKIKYPYYSDVKAKYLKKQKKEGKPV